MASYKNVLCMTAIASLSAMPAFADLARRPVRNPNPIARPIPDPSPINRPIRPMPPVHHGVLAPIHVDPAQTEIKPIGSPVLHRPYLLKDPATGNGNESNAKLISPDTKLTLPNNRTLTAGQYYQELNKFESHVNQFGYTMRKRGNETIPFSETKIDRAAFERKRSSVARNHNAQLIRPLPSLSAHEASHRAALQRLPDLYKSIDNARLRFPGGIIPQPKTFHGSKSWSDSWGWSNKFAAYADARVTVDGTAETTTSSADANGGGFIFGNKLRIVRGTANYNTPKHGNLTADTSFYFLGYKLFNKSYNSPNAVFYDNGDQWSAGLDESTTIHFAIGPIPMSATIGARGGATIGYRMFILPLHANVNIVPGVESKVYIQVGVDIIVGGAGGGSDLTLLNDTLTTQASLQLLNDDKGPYFYETLATDNDMTTLAGRVYAYVFIYVPAWSIPPWEKKQWEWTIFKLGGITASGSVFSEQKRLNLF